MIVEPMAMALALKEVAKSPDVRESFAAVGLAAGAAAVALSAVMLLEALSAVCEKIKKY